MFAPPVANGKNRPTTLASSQFSGSGMEERSSPWAAGEQNSPSFNQNYGEGSHYNEHDGLSSPFLGTGVSGKNERGPYSSFGGPAWVPALRHRHAFFRCHVSIRTEARLTVLSVIPQQPPETPLRWKHGTPTKKDQEATRTAIISE
ncbi:transcription factor E2-alpha-like isoform X2 [Carassius auratus]|nr:transcription factor E2-alpha-like isoform X2 [Carassius auratus]